MLAVKLVVEVDIEAAADAQQAIIDRLDDSSGALRVIGRVLEDYEHDLFATAGRGAWQADDPVTARLKGSSRVLVDSGRLMRNLTTAKRVGSDAVHVGAGDAFYARFLRDGNRGIPKRNPAPAPDQSTVGDWARKLVQYLVDGTSA